MKVLLVNIDSVKMPNLALKKIEMFHKMQGDEVYWGSQPLSFIDKIYVSCVFDWNKPRCLQYEKLGATIGGSGYDIDTKLPDEIEALHPHINFGFTMRGCTRNCSFCIVRKKEGMARPVGDIYDLWDGKSRLITLLDNNILALPDHFKHICSQLRKEKLVVDFNQGLDCRFLTEELMAELRSIKIFQEMHFAFDDLAYKPSVLKALEIIKKFKVRKWGTRWLVYVGEKDTFDTVYERMQILHEAKQLVFIMRDRKVYYKPEFRCLAHWGNTCPSFKMDLYDPKNLNTFMKKFKPFLEQQQQKLF